MNRFVIVRHGNTFETGEALRRIGAGTDLPLVDSGRAQARALGRHFHARGIVFDRVLTAFSRRAVDTTKLIISYQSSPPPAARTPWLDEIDHGPDEGLVEDAVVERVGRDALNAWDTFGRVPEGWNARPEWRQRCWRSLLRTNGDGTTLIVTSNGSARFALLAHPLLQPSSLKLRTGAYGEITRGSEGDLMLECWDRRPPRGATGDLR